MTTVMPMNMQSQSQYMRAQNDDAHSSDKDKSSSNHCGLVALDSYIGNAQPTPVADFTNAMMPVSDGWEQAKLDERHVVPDTLRQLLIKIDARINNIKQHVETLSSVIKVDNLLQYMSQRSAFLRFLLKI